MTAATSRADGPQASPAALAASLRRSARHQLVERQITGLRRRRTEISDEIRALTGQLSGERGASVRSKVTRLSAERDRLEQEISLLRPEYGLHRAERGAAVRAALAPMQADAARRLLHLLAEARSAIQAVDEIGRQIELAGGGDGGRVELPDFGPLEALAHRLTR